VLPEGSISGVRARGGFEQAFQWNEGSLTGLTVKSVNGGECRLKYGENTAEFNTVAGESYSFDGSLNPS
jgi:alpha-L-fucosidase 2